MLTGDFLAPYLLSSIDMGVGMMKMLNGTPIDYLTWGNHEDDIPHKEVIKREREYTGVWINSNMKSHESFPDSTCQVEEEVIQIESADGSNKRRVGLIGVLSNSPSLYRPGAFGGAKIEDPWDCMGSYKKKLEEQKHCDVVVPLCHLYEPQDEKTCRDFDFPVVLSGHDHHVVDRLVSGTRLLKPGQDGIKAVILDLSWPNASSSQTPVIEYEIVNVADWPADEALKKVAEDSYKVLDPLRRTELTQAQLLNSCQIREHVIKQKKRETIDNSLQHHAQHMVYGLLWLNMVTYGYMLSSKRHNKRMVVKSSGASLLSAFVFRPSQGPKSLNGCRGSGSRR